MREPRPGLIIGALGAALLGVAAEELLHRRLRRGPALPPTTPRSPARPVRTSDGLDLHGERDDAEVCDPGRPLVVLVHGYALDLDCFVFQRAHLRGRFDMVLYDQRSHGRSPRAPADSCRIDQLSTDLLSVLDQLVGSTRQVVLVGHSMGAMTIMALARRHPERFLRQVAGVAMLCTSPGEIADHSPLPGLPDQAFVALAPPVAALLQRFPELGPPGRGNGSDLAWLTTRRVGFGSRPDPAAVDFVGDLMSRTPPVVLADFWPLFAELDERDGLAVLDGVPTLLLGAGLDQVTPVEHTEVMRERLPHATTVLLPTAGHLAMVEQPDAVNAALDDLLERARSRSTR